MMQRRMSKHEGPFVSIGQILKLPPRQQDVKTDGKHVANKLGSWGMVWVLGNSIYEIPQAFKANESKDPVGHK